MKLVRNQVLNISIKVMSFFDLKTHYQKLFPELRVWGRAEFLPALEGVDKKLARVFAEISKFWQVPLPLRRLDVIALPNYQGVKPADNWGLIVFK